MKFGVVSISYLPFFFPPLYNICNVLQTAIRQICWYICKTYNGCVGRNNTIQRNQISHACKAYYKQSSEVGQYFFLNCVVRAESGIVDMMDVSLIRQTKKTISHDQHTNKFKICKVTSHQIQNYEKNPYQTSLARSISLSNSFQN